jgi:hypothetical protein
MSDERQVVRDDAGEVAAVYCGQPLDEEGRAAMLDLVAAARRRMAAEDPEGTLGARQAAAIERIRSRQTVQVGPPSARPTGRTVCCADPKNLDGGAHPWVHVTTRGRSGVQPRNRITHRSCRSTSEDGPGDVYRCPECGAVDVD